MQELGRTGPTRVYEITQIKDSNQSSHLEETIAINMFLIVKCTQWYFRSIYLITHLVSTGRRISYYEGNWWNFSSERSETEVRKQNRISL